MDIATEFGLLDQMVEFFTRLLGTENWPPRWRCGRWTDFHGWLYILSDIVIATSYFIIPTLLVVFVLKKKDVPLPRVFWLFGAFILFCGITHLLDAAIFWWPAYRLAALLRFFTAVISILTVIAIIRLVNEALLLKTSKQFEEELNKRKAVEESLIEAREVAEESKKAKEQFLANMSHEIRTPMNAILGFSNLLKETNLDAQQKEWLHTIKVSGENLLVIINDILDFSKIESGKLDFNLGAIDFHAFMNDTMSSVSLTSKQKLIDLELEIAGNVPPSILVDSVRLNQVLLNMLSNSVKFTAKGKVKVKVELYNQVNEVLNLKFTVQDTGMGIPEDKLEKIFEIFTQADSKISAQYGGTGLGLAISKRLIELQGGSIEVQSEVGVGSTFAFTWPFLLSLSQKETKKSILKTEDLIALSGISILLVEDNKINQKLAKVIIEKHGALIDIAENGKEAIELLKIKKYQLVLMDIQIPVMDGYETTIYIRNELKMDLPIISLTAHALKSELDKCIEVGMNDYITKPYKVNELLSKIIKYVK